MIKIKTKQIFLILFMGLFIYTVSFAQKIDTSMQEYVIKPEDILTITVWKHNDLNLKVKVENDGNITFPLIEKVKAAGLTIGQLTDRIAYLLGKDYIVDPYVTITIEKQTFFIYGEVKQPGSYTLVGQLSLLRAISLAGGLTDFASSAVYIKRRVKDEEKKIKVNINSVIQQPDRDIVLQADDVIVIPRRFF